MTSSKKCHFLKVDSLAEFVRRRGILKEDRYRNQMTTDRPSQFIADQNNRELQPTPQEALDAAILRIKQVAYAQGVEAGLSRLEMMAAIIPSSVTKAQIVQMLKNEAEALRGARYIK